ncbi:prolipoprotein diacylglyceryl transferase [Polynucleobacter kasalickyi]|uniref:Phosphatidylglycerol--prolipoprotein diacylglyceryl transferase n=1 Tax=Polynucleobacter kasalickyi TaxID=1938817 RepID=A0A1W1ZPD3_9BURK|nr:prolipoprotein diacylglyceryl transferase [Polynucleobacter kasalickyi]SMC50072.1 Prolipoprotein diacylglyceryl transferase [Polynucleobacter kasalickyi]
MMHPQFDPIAIQIGPLAVHWYGLMYLMAFMQYLALGHLRVQQPQMRAKGFVGQDIEDLLFYAVLGVILGGRLGYCFFYMPSYYLANPLDIFKVWQGGMAFHGGFLGVVVAIAWFAKKRGLHFFTVADLIAPLVPFGLAFGRIGNFINGELWGRPTNATWGMIFPQAGDQLLRHPSQLYQFGGEGVFLGIILWLYARQPREIGQTSGVFALGYGIFRFVVEYSREPDRFLGTLSLGLSMGQWLSIPMILLGIYLCNRKKS